MSNDKTEITTKRGGEENQRGWGFVLWKIKGAGMMLRLQYN